MGRFKISSGSHGSTAFLTMNLPVQSAELELGGNGERPIDHPVREERNASLERVSHARPVEPRKHRRGQIDRQIGEQELLERRQFGARPGRKIFFLERRKRSLAFEALRERGREQLEAFGASPISVAAKNC